MQVNKENMKTEKKFEISGRFKKGSKEGRFTKIVSAWSKKHAIEKVCSLMGSKNRILKRNISIETIKEIK